MNLPGPSWPFPCSKKKTSKTQKSKNKIGGYLPKVLFFNAFELDFIKNQPWMSNKEYGRDNVM
jgi:hypothetical protein